MKKPLQANIVLRGFIFCVAFSFHLTVNASTYQYRYDSNLRSAYTLTLKLRLVEAQAELKSLRVQDPNNLAVVHIENYLDFFTLFVKEEKSTYKKLLPNRALRISHLEKFGNIKDPYHRFAKAEILLQWALVKLKFDEKLSASSDLIEAYKLLEENQKLFPDFVETNKSLSVMHALGESIPTWIRKLTKIKGSLSLADKEISSLYQFSKKTNHFFEEEITTIYGFFLYHQLNKKTEGQHIINQLEISQKDSPMVAFLKASFAIKQGQNDLALGFLQDAPSDSKYLRFDYLDLLRGKCLLYKLDANAIVYLTKFVQNFGGEHYIKEGYQKLAWSAMIFGNSPVEYRRYLDLVKKKGKSVADEDNQALREAKSTIMPNPNILKARILFDGGYYQDALDILNGTPQLANNPNFKIEYSYRLARCFQALKNQSEAIKSFTTVLSQAKSTESYITCNTALQLGSIYEAQGKNTQAKSYYDLCLSINSPEYKNSLHQRAKAGLERLSQ